MTTLLNINGKDHQIDLPDDTPILWTLRDQLGMTGTKFGCGMALCGACTVHLDGSAIRSCVTPIAAAAGKKITTIEAVSQDTVGKSIQDAWQMFGVPQCGYCQSGQIMSATALLTTTPHPNDQQIKEAMSGNICRCGTYTRIHAAIKYASQRIHVSNVNAPPVKIPAAAPVSVVPAPATAGAPK
jgi:isoquinoline 1-oxidoreductase alpha subunit